MANVVLVPEAGERFTVTVELAVSPQFFAWLFGFGARAQILAPDSVAEQYRQTLREALEAAK